MSLVNTKSVILDVDTGSDDAVAIMTALKSKILDVKAICTVWGNLDVEKTTLNTLGVCDALQREIPVYKGCSRPMTRDRLKGREMMNSYAPVFKDGKELKIHYDYLEGLPTTSKRAENIHAVQFYYDYLSAARAPVTIIAVGPLTNLGFLFRLAPHLSKKVEQLIIMGGGVDITNASATGEANIWHDPEALQIILNTGVHPLIVPLDATHSAPLNLADCEQLEELDTFAGIFTARLVRQRIEFESSVFGESRKWSPIHDALAVAACIDPAVFTRTIEAHCEVGQKGICDGELLIDRKAVPQEPNCTIALAADKTAFFSLLITLFSKK